MNANQEQLPLNPVSPLITAKKSTTVSKLERGFNLLSGKERLTVKQITQQLDALGHLFSTGSDKFGIEASGTDDLQRGRQILCALRLNSYSVDELFIDEHLLPRVLLRMRDKSEKAIRAMLAIRRELIAFDRLLKAHLENGQPNYSFDFTISGFDSIRRARLTLLAACNTKT